MAGYWISGHSQYANLPRSSLLEHHRANPSDLQGISFLGESSDRLRTRFTFTRTAMHDDVCSPLEWILQGWGAEGGIYNHLYVLPVSLLSVVLDTPYLSCRIQRCLDPTNVPVFVLIVKTDYRNLRPSYFLQFLDNFKDAVVSTRYRYTFGLEVCQSLRVEMRPIRL